MVETISMLFIHFKMMFVLTIQGKDQSKSVLMSVVLSAILSIVTERGVGMAF